MKLGLRSKIEISLIGLTLLLTLIAMGAFALLQGGLLDSSVRGEISRTGAALGHYVSQRLARLTTDASLVADLPTLKSAMMAGPDGGATVNELFSEYQHKLGIQSFVITDNRGHIVTDDGSVAKGVDVPPNLPGVAVALNGRTWSGVIPRGDMLYLGVSVPVRVGAYVQGTISTFERIDTPAAKEIGAMAGADVAFILKGKVIGSSLPIGKGVDSRSTGLIDVWSNQERYVGVCANFPGAEKLDDASILALCPYDDLVAPFRATRSTLYGILAAVLLLSVALARVLSGRVVSQIEGLVKAARTIQAGSWPDPIRVSGTDEIGLLESAFNDMTGAMLAGKRQLELQAEDLKGALVRAEAATKAKSQFLANMSHEIRTPMNGVIGMADLMLETPLNVSQREYAQTIVDSGRTLMTVINSILDYSKIEAGQLTFEKSEFDLSELLLHEVRLNTPAAQHSGIEFRSELAPSTECLVVGDQVRIAQVISNLLGNAIKFTSQGAVVLSAKIVEPSNPDRRLVVSVRDSGLGIAPDRLDSIFQPFTQEDESTTRRFGGTGLGLSICRQLVNGMGGTISVTSELGKWSEFQFEIPLDVAASAKIYMLPDRNTDLTETGPAARLRVLLVEDNATNRKVCTRILETLGCEVAVAENGAIAVERAGERFDVILMDCHMPVMDGFEATRIIRHLEAASGHRTPIVAITASALDEDRRRCLDSGMDEFLVKPIHRQTILDALLSVRRSIAA